MSRYGTFKPGSEAEDIARSLDLLRSALKSGEVGEATLIGRCWPDRNQTLLFKVLFERPPAAAAAWNEWRSDNDPETMDVPSMRLVPQLHRRLRRLGIDDPWMPKFKGSYRKTWTNNQRMLLHALPALSELHRAAIPVLALKGLAITLQYLGADFGLRSMFDLDLLVSTRRVYAAIDVLVKSGWHFNSGRSVQHLKERIIPKENGREFVKDLGHVDLHWHMLHQDPSAWMDEWVWKTTTPVEFRGHRLSVPSPAALLLNVCLHGVKYCAIPSIVWAADALSIALDDRSEVDWKAVVQVARDRRLVLPLLDSLSYLTTVVDTAVPAEVLDDLRSARVSPIEHLEYRAITTARSQRDPLAQAAMNYLVSLRQRHACVKPTEQLESHSAWALKAASPGSKRALSRAFSVRSRW